MKVLVGFSNMSSPLGILHNVEEVETKGEKKIINIFFSNKNDAEKQFNSHQGFKVHLDNRIELVTTIDNRYLIRIYNKHDIDIIVSNDDENDNENI